ncbi:MAG: TIR domain-containing protein [Chloroflexi bacterium]|nr:TIR domain-containing protein [Chloroflexota bacterium]
MGHVFVSYNSEDSEFAAGLMRQIEGAGFQTWSDHSRLRTGEKWRDATDQALREAFAVIVLVTPEAIQSDQVTYEWTFALGMGIQVIPVMLRPATLHPRLAMLPRLDFTSPADQPWGRLIRQIQEASGSRRPASPFQRPGSPFPLRPGSLFDRIRSREQDSDFRESGDLADEPLARLLEMLEHDDRDARITAAQRLGEIGDRAAVPGLLRLLRDDDWRVRDTAAQALGKMKVAAAVPGLLEALRLGRPGPFGGGSSSSNVSWAIREIGAAAVPVLIDALGDEDPRIRQFAAEMLGEIGGADGVAPLASALHDAEGRVRWQAADSLGKLGTVTAVPDLILSLRDSASEVRLAATWALAQIADESAVPGLIKTLYDRDWRVRWAAAEALWAIGEPAILPLIELLRERQEPVQRAAIRALVEIGEASIPPLLHLLSETNWEVRWVAAEALQEMGAAAVAPLLDVLETGDWQASWAAAEALKHIGTPDALKAVEGWREGLPDDTPDAPEG